ncbi:phage antirepressor Ant [Clostridium novyi]|uniref:Antirepressor, putative n=1 Tax=Clostridium novyi (strain NT) TaxID=386415 RepID=A0Q0W8_CLONN|nr:phage antirepressor Ant [Clostridium novyi]ABK60394.1 antirepressor, putative [Clostridium novyi NT]KEH88638.1 antirepressor [Clostridium novyi A str. NCTC 538]
MNKLVNVKNKDGQLVVTSRQIAGDFQKRHSHVVEAIENKIKSLTTENSEVEISKLFIPTSFNHNGNEYKEYLLTRDGFTFIVMGFTGAKADAWKLKYIEAFNKMEKVLKTKQLSPMEQLKLQYEVIEEHEEKLSSIETKVNKLENSMTIDYAQQEELSSLARKIVVQALGGKNTPAYKELNKKAFSTLWRDFKRIMQVNSYKNTSVKQFYRAKDLINNWKPNRELELMIKGANSQMSF